MDENFAQIDVLLRGGAITVLLICAAVFAIAQGSDRKALSLGALCFGLSAYLLISTPNLAFFAGWWMQLMIMLASAVPVLAYWAGFELFVDRPVFRWWHFVLAGLVIFGAWFAAYIPYAIQIRAVLVLSLSVHLAFMAVVSAAGDLLEERRRFRRWFLIVMALVGGAISVIEFLKLDEEMPASIYPLHALLFLTLAVIFLLWAVRVAPNFWIIESRVSSPGSDLTPAEAAVLARVQGAMQRKIWQQEGLSIGALAAHINAPEHRVRRAINQGLGHRNFTQFINEHRIAAAKVFLSDPQHSDRVILSIAYDVGYASLGPFNRAFREITGQSPTEFRRTAVIT